MPDTPPPVETVELLGAFNFRVRLFLSAGIAPPPPSPDPAVPGTSLADGGFQECSGLEIDLDVQEIVEGGRNDGVVRRVGRAKYQPITLKRGMFAVTRGAPAVTQLWAWLQGIASGTLPVLRYDGVVEVLHTPGGAAAAHWSFVRGLPAKISGPQLNAKTGEIAIEELQIAHEGLRLERG